MVQDEPASPEFHGLVTEGSVWGQVLTIDKSEWSGGLAGRSAVPLIDGQT